VIPTVQQPVASALYLFDKIQPAYAFYILFRDFIFGYRFPDKIVLLFPMATPKSIILGYSDQN